jgi:hypothetical protein
MLYMATRSPDPWLYLLSPSCVCVGYMLLNGIVGSSAFYFGRVYHLHDYNSYLGWNYLHGSACFNLLSNLVVLLAGRPLRALRGTSEIKSEWQGGSLVEVLAVLVFAAANLVLFSYVDLDLSGLGGQGSFSFFPKALVAIAAIIALARYGGRNRAVLYILLVTYFASFSAGDKRQAIFLFLPIFLVEFLRSKKRRLDIRMLLAGGVAASIGFILILWMSIYRGYGEYNPETFLDAAQYIDDYVQEDRFIEYVLANTETNYVFFHTHQAIEYVLEDPQRLLLGSSFLKVLFIPVPRHLFPDKPVSIIEHYTSAYAPEFRSLGGSWVSGLYSEYFWNFHFLGLLPMYFVFALFGRAYSWMAGRIRTNLDYQLLLPIYYYQQFMEMVRGSGLDQYLTYSLVASLLAISIVQPVLFLMATVARRRSTNRGRLSGSLQ